MIETLVVFGGCFLMYLGAFERKRYALYFVTGVAGITLVSLLALSFVVTILEGIANAQGF